MTMNTNDHMGYLWLGYQHDRWNGWADDGLYVDGKLHKAPFVKPGSEIYGYGDCGIYPASDRCLCVDQATQDLWVWHEGWEHLLSGQGAVYGDGCYWVERAGWVLVRTQPTSDMAELVLLQQDGQLSVLATAYGLGSPRVSPAGDLVYIAWGENAMPWDQTDVCLIPLSGESVTCALPSAAWMQPIWQDAEHLLLLGDSSGKWQCYTYHLPSVSLTTFAACPGEIGDAQWSRDQIFHLWNQGTWCAVTYYSGLARFVLRDKKGRWHKLPIPGTQCLRLYHDSDSFYIKSSGPQGESVTQVSNAGQVMASTHQYTEIMPERQLWLPKKNGCVQTWVVRRGEGPQPWICWLHGGPTGQAGPQRGVFDAYLAMGMTVLVINFTGSTGMGTAHRQQLYGHWGKQDVADVLAVIKHSISLRLLIPGKGFVMGRSASGFSACAIAAQIPLAGLILYYPVVDVGALLAIEDSFERGYTQKLIGTRDRFSPNVPVCHIHGSDDRIVPIETMSGWLSSLNPAQLSQYVIDGQGHGFSEQGKQQAWVYERDFIMNNIERN